jgi:hypothetical protein
MELSDFFEAIKKFTSATLFGVWCNEWFGVFYDSSSIAQIACVESLAFVEELAHQS